MYGESSGTAIVRGRGKITFYFSRTTFRRMKERKNSHYCFRCGGTVGFIPSIGGQVLNAADPDGCRPNPMKDHDPVLHGDSVIGSADLYASAVEWLEKAWIPENFPFQVTLT
jgi:hypothetical protein